MHLPLELITQSELDQARIDRRLGDDAKQRVVRLNGRSPNIAVWGQRELRVVE